MIQRKQSLFLLCALILTILTLCLPLGTLEPKALTGAVAVTEFTTLPLESAGIMGWIGRGALILSAVVCLLSIFDFKDRKRQMDETVFCIILCVLWAVVAGYRAFAVFPAVGSFTFHWSAILPVVNIILYLMARHGIKQDEELIKSMDRIR
ncbi:MAG: DUF4293 domain-containing protein [Prevotella sp.]|uniref:DUF4293 domain-containing protein n=1 Tax=Prevotella sp. AGR2160 TaxID=1280674 RepID=UPI0003F6EDDB|nr:DUF4293 domain-containing protein [Prevotella sp. AGR2160]MDD5860992.1 DUF4293 domain-containing protein [Prevotella sp.]